MKIDRLLGIITVLINKDRTKAKDLAEKFEVSVRTIHRDIEDICKAGIPIVTYQGGAGGISIAEGYNFDKSILTVDELDNIIIGLKSVESISSNPNIKFLLEKLAPKQGDIMSISNNIFIDLSSFYKTSLSQKINTIKDAMANKKEVTFRYYSNKGKSERQIEPYFITFKWSAWYVFGYCKARKDFRLFKLNRVDALKITDIIFITRDIPRERTQLDDYFISGQIVTMLIDRSLEYHIVDTYGVDSYEITVDNRIKFDLPYTNHDYAIQFILGLGDKVKILMPKHIIEELKTQAKNILDIYK